MKLEDLKCEFCQGEGWFSRDSDGAAIEGECSYCKGTGIEDNFVDNLMKAMKDCLVDAELRCRALGLDPMKYGTVINAKALIIQYSFLTQPKADEQREAEKVHEIGHIKEQDTER